MDRADFRLRALLLDVEQHLNEDERRKLVFLIGCEDIPRRLLDAYSKDTSQSMSDIWETLFDRRKITTNNVNYLIERLDKLKRADLVQMLKNYCPVPFSLSASPLMSTTGQAAQRVPASDLFTQIDPQ